MGDTAPHVVARGNFGDATGWSHVSKDSAVSEVCATVVHGSMISGISFKLGSKVVQEGDTGGAGYECWALKPDEFITKAYVRVRSDYLGYEVKFLQFNTSANRSSPAWGSSVDYDWEEGLQTIVAPSGLHLVG